MEVTEFDLLDFLLMTRLDFIELEVEVFDVFLILGQDEIPLVDNLVLEISLGLFDLTVTLEVLLGSLIQFFRLYFLCSVKS